MTYLLDVNVLIALIEPNHPHNALALTWFDAIGRNGWATCPMTENAVVRIVGHPSYPNWPGNPSVAAGLLSTFTEHPGHSFWPDDISMLDATRFDLARLATSSHVTDSYLVALAVAHSGKLATFDRRLMTDAVHRGAQGLHLIGSP